MGGKIELESEEGMGSTFSITLRLPRAPERVDLTAPALPVPGSVLGAAASWPVPIPVPLQVLVADDHVVNQILCKTMLQKMGHMVTIANKGAEALALFGERAWDLVLMDMQMPTMDGLAATRLIRLSEPSGRRTPIVAMTANVMASDQQACLAAGMDDFMSKPFKLATLQGLINRLVKRVSVVEGLK
jgi:CheY-like chemotaxis protein